MKDTIITFRQDLSLWWTKIRHGGGAEYMRALYRDAMAWCESALEGARRATTAIRSEFARMADRWGSGLPPDEEPKVLYYPTLVSRAANVGGWFALLLEGLIAGSMSVWLFNLPALWAFVIGTCVCVATAIFIKGLCAPILLARAEAHPKQAAHWLLVLLLILTPIEFGLLTMAFLVRGATGDFALLIGWTFGAVMGILSVSTPILAALLFTAAGLFGWSYKLTLLYEEGLQLERDIQSLRSASERQLSQLLTSQYYPAEQSTVTIRLKPSAIEGGQAVFGDVQLINGASATETEVALKSDHSAVQLPASVAIAPHSRTVSFAGMTAPVSELVTATISARLGSTLTTARLTISPRNGNRIAVGTPVIALAALLWGTSPSQAQQLARIWIDRTSSVVEEELNRALNQSASELPAISANKGIRKWEFYHFADDAWTTVPYYSFTIPNAPNTVCEGPTLTEAEKAFRGLYEARKHKAEQECARRSQNETQQYARTIDGLFGGAHAQLVAGKSGGRCTALFDLFTRISYDSEPTLNFVETDGVESCQALHKVPPPVSGSSAVIILLGNKNAGASTAGDEFLARAATLQAYLPWVKVVPFWAFTTAGLTNKNSSLAVHAAQYRTLR